MKWIKASEKLPSVGIYNALYNGDHIIFQVHDGGFRVINYHGERDDSPKLNLVKWLSESPSEQSSIVGVEEMANNWALENADDTMATNSALNRAFKAGFKAGYAASEGSPLDELKSFLLAKAKELNIYVDFSDKSYDGDKSAPMDLFGFIEYLCNQSSTSEEEKDLWEEVANVLYGFEMGRRFDINELLSTYKISKR